jgi:hypothetical protein
MVRPNRASNGPSKDSHASAAGAAIDAAGASASQACVVRAVAHGVDARPVARLGVRWPRAVLREMLPLALAVALVGCESPQQNPSSVAPVRPVSDTALTAPAPVGRPNEVANRATRIAWSGLSKVGRRDAGQTPTLDVRVDSLDANGDFAVASGQFRIVVRAEGCEPESQTFELSVSGEDEQRRHLDSVLGQYVLRVEPRWTRPPAEGARLSVTVSIATVLGTTLSTEGSMRW